MERLLDIVTLLSLLLAVSVLRSVRRQHIRVEYSVSWLAAAVLLLALSRMPAVFVWAAAFLGLPSASDALLFLLLTVFVVVFYRISRRQSDLKDTTIALTQRLAILEYQLNQRNEKDPSSPSR